MNAFLREPAIIVEKRTFAVEVSVQQSLDLCNRCLRICERADELLEEAVKNATENVLMSSEEMVLMQTAKCNVFNKVNGKQENIRMLFDSGS